jgi:glycosyltransferase involved in cell wall biosynthesis
MSSPLSRKFLRVRDILWTSPTLLYDRLRHRGEISPTPSLYYIIPEANWVTDWVGRYLTHEIHQKYGWTTHLTSAPEIISGQVVHFGEMGSFLNALGKPCTYNNTIISTIFHGVRGNQFPALAAQTELFLQNAHIPRHIVTACKMMQVRLQSWGIPSAKISCLPLGIDLKRFYPAVKNEREKIRHELNISPDSICIGSFQKDGDGWGEGLVPKLIKGPDIFLEVLDRLKSQFPIVVLLSGPARGYAKQGLKKLGIPFRHVIVKHYPDICHLYHALDLYLVTSREEGGPLAVLEALATGTPILSSEVGLAPDVIQHEWNGFLAGVEDIDSLVEFASLLIDSASLRSLFQQNGLQSIQAYDWPRIASRYYEEVYLPLIQRS